MPVDMNAWQSTTTQLDYNEPPPPGMYDVRVDSADIFESKAGDTYLKMTYTIVGHQHTGHQWQAIHGFKDTQLAFTKAHIKRLGVDVATIKTEDELEAALEGIVGRHFTVEVVQRGPYTNTDVKAAAPAPVAAPDIPIPGITNGTKTPRHNDDDLPF